MSDDAPRLLVVDDVADAADTLAMKLRLAGYRVATAYTAEQAVLEMEAQQPRCVLLDICMPGLDGYDLATLLRHRYKEEVVLIAVTGADETQARVSATLSVVDHHLRKPVDTQALQRLLAPTGARRA